MSTSGDVGGIHYTLYIIQGENYPRIKAKSYSVLES